MVIVLAAVAAGLAVALLVLKLTSDRTRARLASENDALARTNAQLKSDVESLAQYRGVADAAAEAERIRRDAAADAAATVAEAARVRTEADRVLTTARQDALRQAVNASADASALRAQAAQLVADANARAQSIIREGTAAGERIRREAEAEAAALVARAATDSAQRTATATDEATRLRAQANQLLADARSRVESIVTSANEAARSVIENANKRAEEIAGSAFDALKNSEKYERAAAAMKNLIEGYGDRYMVPSRSLLDDLADEYAFTAAGEELKNARERTRLMVKNSTAATCDYVEANRRDTAVRFVVDAFNGKVDSILSRVKSDNAGTLEQEVRDAWTMVNHNGAAFRNARILETYLDARLTELRWGATAQEIKLRDREEQKRIKDQMREEERAQREFERSMREAARDEDALRKAMEKVQGQVDKASEEQRAKYEAQLADLGEKLKQAEERGQRALSMAQQTKMGHVYVISNTGSFGDDVFKIGLTRRLEPLDRVRELGDASVPFAFDVHAMIHSDDSPALEHALHKHFLTAQMNKVNPRKEFFRVPLSVIREEIEKLGIKASWTLAAEAKEYRETLAIEKALRENPEKGREWLQRQANAAPADFRDDDDDAATSAAPA